MTSIEQEVDQLFVYYFRDFSNLDLKAIVSYFHLPCTFIVPQEIVVFSSASESASEPAGLVHHVLQGFAFVE